MDHFILNFKILLNIVSKQHNHPGFSGLCTAYTYVRYARKTLTPDLQCIENNMLESSAYKAHISRVNRFNIHLLYNVEQIRHFRSRCLRYGPCLHDIVYTYSLTRVCKQSHTGTTVLTMPAKCVT